MLALLVESCQTQSVPFSEWTWQILNGREEKPGDPRPSLYRAKVPLAWIRKDPAPTDSIIDTTKPICEFYIPTEKEPLRLTIHTFPVISAESRIPPSAQVARWKNQFDALDPLHVYVKSLSQGGFIGLLLEAHGIYQGQKQVMLGWSVQLAPEYDRMLAISSSFDKQRRADYTIKIVGAPELIDKHRHALFLFANSFELIEELPHPL
ncbi:hypothetical protein [Candidatus Protochlamydia phocaeensis]|uniref:hypothetical protein n=1 Tax=Candidatus Protochlamydia phocaeensis TaxID=1414722 RepID=UPI000837DF26|nr:hypothetical protein [Candidatus Protochlamydia phocaeensis]